MSTSSDTVTLSRLDLQKLLVMAVASAEWREIIGHGEGLTDSEEALFARVTAATGMTRPPYDPSYTG